MDFQSHLGPKPGLLLKTKAKMQYHMLQFSLGKFPIKIKNARVKRAETAVATRLNLSFQTRGTTRLPVDQTINELNFDQSDNFLSICFCFCYRIKLNGFAGFCPLNDYLKSRKFDSRLSENGVSCASLTLAFNLQSFLRVVHK